MKLITRNTDYAIRAVCNIALQNPKVVSVVDLVKALGIPRPFLRKILQILNRNDVLISHKGQGGGFTLAKPAGKIYLLDMVKIFQGELKINECLFKKALCPNIRTCALRKRITKIERFALEQLKSVTIKVLVSGS